MIRLRRHYKANGPNRLSTQNKKFLLLLLEPISSQFIFIIYFEKYEAIARVVLSNEPKQLPIFGRVLPPNLKPSLLPPKPPLSLTQACN